MTHRRVAALGITLGVTFTIGALIADLAHSRRLPRFDPFLDAADFLSRLPLLLSNDNPSGNTDVPTF